MKPISASSFCNKYPLNVGESFIVPGKKRFITDDLYIIQSRHKYRTYNNRLYAGPIQTHKYKSVYKLMSKKCNFTMRTDDNKEQCLIAFDHSGICSYKESLIQDYATDLMAMKKAGHSRKRGEFLIDAIYYKTHPLVMNYRDGRFWI